MLTKAFLRGLDNPAHLIGVTALGFILPRFISETHDSRPPRHRLGLPDALDLTVICVEAGPLSIKPSRAWVRIFTIASRSQP